MISNRCARKSLVTNCNSIISKNYSRFLVDSNEVYYKLNDRTDMYYVSFSQKKLSNEDILYSIKKELIKYLNLTSGEKLEIISINRIR